MKQFSSFAAIRTFYYFIGLTHLSAPIPRTSRMNGDFAIDLQSFQLYIHISTLIFWIHPAVFGIEQTPKGGIYGTNLHLPIPHPYLVVVAKIYSFRRSYP